MLAALDPTAPLPRRHEARRTEVGVQTHQVILIYTRISDNHLVGGFGSGRMPKRT